ncbi:MAG: maltose alpha-D-glucosyltransferase [bacterium]
MKQDDPLWYKDAIIYQLHVKAFYDADGDGTGDFAGLQQKLDHVEQLGATTLWLLPFYPSPLRDDGYDIADYTEVNPRYGDLAAVRAFIDEAHRRGLRVITELVINHTSDKHPWFERARNAPPGSPERDFYVWSDTDEPYPGVRIIFCDTEASNWTWDPVARQYFWHRFYSHQPDLNWENPAVFDEVTRVMSFWFDMGVDGMRLDAIPYLCERDGTSCENLEETHAVIRRLRRWLDENHPGKMLLGEANMWPEDVLPYFGTPDAPECHMNFHFPLMPRLYMALAREDRHPITDILRQTPAIPEGAQWAIFLRNHDELTLEMVTDRERDYLWDVYASEKRARINQGIRRRLAPLLDNDRRKIELLNSLLLSMPGTPIIYYGDEIGMGDNIFLGDRDGVRTPMQWSPDRNGGFSKADPARLFLPAVMDPIYGFEAVNVESQQRNPSSLLNWMRRLISIRRQQQVFGRGTLRFLQPENRKVLAYLRELDDAVVLCVANVSRRPQACQLDLAEFRGRVPVELSGPSPFAPIGDGPWHLTLPAYGFFWFRLVADASHLDGGEESKAQMPELVTLVTPRGWDGLLDGDAGDVLRRDVLARWLPGRRWFAGEAVDVALDDHARIDARLALARLAVGDGRWLAPLGVDWESRGHDPAEGRADDILARMRRGAQIGVLYDAAVDSEGVRSLLRWAAKGEAVATARGGEVVSSMAPGFGDVIDQLPIRRLGVEQSNTSTVVGEHWLLKVYRRLEPGTHPEPEVGRYLAEVAGYPHTPRFEGSVSWRDPDGGEATVAVLHRFVANQGDGWRWLRDRLDAALDTLLMTPDADVVDGFAEPLARIELLGRRIGELHRALCTPGGGEAFDPAPTSADDIERWLDDVRAQAAAARAALEAHADQPANKALIAGWKRIEARIDALAPGAIDAKTTRHHGDLHLGQVLVVEGDWVVIDFEGEPARPLAERRRKHSPLRDVAGMVRSFDYAVGVTLHERARARVIDRDALAAPMAALRDAMATAFLSGWEVASEGIDSRPTGEAGARLLDLFLLEKALYEVAYEAAYRPDWLAIPAAAVHRLVDV